MHGGERTLLFDRLLHTALAKDPLPQFSGSGNCRCGMSLGDRDEPDRIRRPTRAPGCAGDARVNLFEPRGNRDQRFVAYMSLADLAAAVRR
jgi:hypothetical protein